MNTPLTTRINAAKNLPTVSTLPQWKQNALTARSLDRKSADQFLQSFRQIAQNSLPAKLPSSLNR